MQERNSVVGVFGSSADAEACIEGFRDEGIDLAKLSVAGREERPEEGGGGRGNPGGRVPVRGGPGAPWIGLRGLPAGPTHFTIPGIGPLVVFGPLAGRIADALAGALVIGGLTAAGAALYVIGIPEIDILRYEEALESGRLLVIAYGTAEEASRAREILEAAGAARTAIHPYLA
jgi:hypothetical protein